MITLRFATRLLRRAGPVLALAALSATVSPSTGAAALGKVTPNPFSGSMRFAYSIQAPSTHVDIAIFDATGRRMRILAHGTQKAGEYEATWDGTREDGVRVPSGLYLLRAAVGSERRILRVTYMNE